MVFPILQPPFTIRVMEPGDAADVQRSRTHPENERYNGWRPETVDEVAAHARKQSADTVGREVGVVQLVIEHDGRFVGDFGVQTVGQPSTIELGLAVAPEMKGQGIATRASAILIAELFRQGMHRVVARVDPRNEPSLKLFDRLGFRREGHERQCYWDDVYGEWTDEVLFAALRSEWGAP